MWDCFSKDLQTTLGSKGMGIGNHSTEPETLAKTKAITVTTQNVLVNVNIFLCMKRQKSESVRLYLILGRLTGTERHCYWTLPMGQTS